ncbi:MAG: sigma-70 family RNA polymerase sigma factor, partial [Ruminococcus sp.]|nr:sigma-70 family RNA polymerase sigma factor [Ruminococcus sp.]
MQYNKVEICGVNTNALKVLTEEEKKELIRIIHTGSEEERKKAREEMISGNLKLVLSVIQRFVGRGENLDDLFQVGVIGLIKAIDNFDPSLDVRFSTYGVPMVCGELRRYLRDNNSIRVSRSLRDTAYHAMQIKEELTTENGREPSVEEIAEKLGVSKEQVVMALEA